MVYNKQRIQFSIVIPHIPILVGLTKTFLTEMKHTAY
jgi:hypothetical protein